MTIKIENLDGLPLGVIWCPGCGINPILSGRPSCGACRDKAWCRIGKETAVSTTERKADKERISKNAELSGYQVTTQTILRQIALGLHSGWIDVVDGRIVPKPGFDGHLDAVIKKRGERVPPQRPVLRSKMVSPKQIANAISGLKVADIYRMLSGTPKIDGIYQLPRPVRIQVGTLSSGTPAMSGGSFNPLHQSDSSEFSITSGLLSGVPIVSDEAFRAAIAPWRYVKLIVCAYVDGCHFQFVTKA